MFRGRHITIATKHGKEKALAPLVSTILQAHPITLKEIDTDQFGTFSGEIERMGNPQETLRAKAALAHALCRADRIIVSEGSFGAHPGISFVQANEEWLLYKDFHLNHEVIVRSLSTETNYEQREIRDLESLIAFAQVKNFPLNGLILFGMSKNETRCYVKDIRDMDSLVEAFEQLMTTHGSVMAQTDMRAHRNQLRMDHIEQTGKKLMDRLLQSCPECHYPGFGITSVKRGLPCKYCLAPTNALLAEICQCTNCQHETKNYYPAQSRFADPGICQFCNP